MTSQHSHNDFMREALVEAKKASDIGEVPIGAVLVHNSKIIARSFNQIETKKCVSAHAELLAIELASKALDNWRLSETTLYVTLEPCAMCLGAIRLARIPRVVFGAGDSRQGGIALCSALIEDPNIGPPLEITQGVLEEECRSILQDFFRERRKQNSEKTQL